MHRLIDFDHCGGQTHPTLRAQELRAPAPSKADPEVARDAVAVSLMSRHSALRMALRWLR